MTRGPARMRAGWVRGAGVAATIVLLLASCTGDQASEAVRFRAPDPPCPPPSALETLPIADERSEVLFDPALTVSAPTLIEQADHFLMTCTYDRGEDGDADAALPREYARISARIVLYRAWNDSPNSQVRAYDELPVSSGDLGDWEAAAQVRDDPSVLGEGCGPAAPCEEGEEPTERSYRLHWEFSGHVDNLDFANVAVTYRVERLPLDLAASMEPTVVAIFRDLVLAVLDGYERAD
jgi:hypothetical protein